MMAIDPPLGYSVRAPADSREETYKTQVADKSITLVKSAIHQYLDSFLNTKGKFRPYLGATLSSEGLQYVTDLTYDEEMKVDPNKRKTYLARFFAENTGRLPSLLIIDQGIEDGDVGLNSLIEGFGYQNRWKGTLSYLAKVSLSVMVATYSEEDTTTLSSTIFYIFGTLSDAINNRLIREPGNMWEVRLPISGITAGQMTNITVEGDSKSQIWTRSIELTCDFETISEIQAPTDQIVLPAMGYVAQNGGFIPRILNMQPNQGISLGSTYPLMIEGMQLKHSLGVSDPSVALITSEPPWLLQPRRQGKAVLYIYDSTLPLDQDLATGRKKNLIVDIPFKVTL